MNRILSFFLISIFLISCSKAEKKEVQKKVKEKIDLDNISVDSIPTLTADNFIVEEPEKKNVGVKKSVGLTMTEIIVPSDVKLPGEEILLGKTWKPTQNNSIVAEWRGQYTDRRIGEMRISILHPSNVELDLRWHDPMSYGKHMLDKKLFDKILIDAPCSGTGVIRGHPDIKLLRKLKDLSQATSIQTKILENLWSLLKPGGELVYATCSILKDENERQIKTFLNNFKDAKHIDIELPWGEGEIGKQKLPEKNYDGFYYAKLLKK